MMYDAHHGALNNSLIPSSEARLLKVQSWMRDWSVTLLFNYLKIILHRHLFICCLSLSSFFFPFCFFFYLQHL